MQQPIRTVSYTETTTRVHVFVDYKNEVFLRETIDHKIIRPVKTKFQPTKQANVCPC